MLLRGPERVDFFSESGKKGVMFFSIGICFFVLYYRNANAGKLLYILYRYFSFLFDAAEYFFNVL